VKLVDAGFVWTEPHSRRLKVKLTIQAEVMNGAILQQSFVVEYVVEPHMCMDCTRANTNTNIWTACAQVRPKQLWQLHRIFVFIITDFLCMVCSLLSCHAVVCLLRCVPRIRLRRKQPQPDDIKGESSTASCGSSLQAV
jgi:hypothetical protein